MWVGPIYWMEGNFSVATPLKKLTLSIPAAISFHLFFRKRWSLTSPSQSPEGIFLDTASWDLVQITRTSASSWVQWLPRRHLFVAYLPILWLLLSSCLLFLSCSLVGSDTVVPFEAEHSTNIWVSALTTAHCHKKILWWRLGATLIYGYKHKDLEDSLTMRPCSKTIVLVPQ